MTLKYNQAIKTSEHLNRNSIQKYSVSTLKPVDPAAKRQLLGCQSKDVTVDLMGFLMCLATHQSFS